MTYPECSFHFVFLFCFALVLRSWDIRLKRDEVRFASTPNEKFCLWGRFRRQTGKPPVDFNSQLITSSRASCQISWVVYIIPSQNRSRSNLYPQPRSILKAPLRVQSARQARPCEDYGCKRRRGIQLALEGPSQPGWWRGR